MSLLGSHVSTLRLSMSTATISTRNQTMCSPRPALEALATPLKSLQIATSPLPFPQHLSPLSMICWT